MRTLHLFAGAGGGILADILLGHRCVGAVECDDYAQQVLLARQKDGCLPWFPIFPDVRTFDGFQYRGLVDCVSGGFPCQDISCAGKGAGIDGERSGLWKEFARIICEVGPRYVFVENSPILTSRGLGTVLGDLAKMGYDARWGVLGACDAGLEMLRDRIWILASRDGFGASRLEQAVNSGFPRPRWENREADLRVVSRNPFDPTTCWPKPLLRRGDDEMASRVDRIRCVGNGQVPAVAALAWKLLTQ